MKRNRPKQHRRRLKSGKCIVVNKGVKRRTKRRRSVHPVTGKYTPGKEMSDVTFNSIMKKNQKDAEENKRLNFGYFPLRKERDLKIEWDKEKLANYYDAEFLQKEDDKTREADKISDMSEEQIEKEKKKDFRPPLLYKQRVLGRTEELYDEAAKGLKIWDPNEKVTKFKKVPFEDLPQEAQMEANLIRGGFWDDQMPDNKKLKGYNKKIVDPMKIKKMEERRNRFR